MRSSDDPSHKMIRQILGAVRDYEREIISHGCDRADRQEQHTMGSPTGFPRVRLTEQTVAG
ncbi:MAG: hypothetical protein ACRDV4_03070 [Acidimicrobiales bacterium]